MAERFNPLDPLGIFGRVKKDVDRIAGSAKLPVPPGLPGLTTKPHRGIGNPIPEKKEPWQTTRKEYVESARQWRAEHMPGLTGRALEDELQKVEAGHYRIVQNAIGFGKPVPAEVLADYPGLK